MHGPRVLAIGVLAAATGATHADDLLRLSLVDDQIERPVFVTAPPRDIERVFVVELHYED